MTAFDSSQAASDSAPEAERARHFLVVDDDANIRRDYARMLRRPGNAVDTAENGKQAIERPRVGSYDVVLSDIPMPEMGGLAFLRAVRERDLDLPVILMTGDPGLESALQAVEYGAFRYLLKPVSLEELVRVATQAAQVYRMAKLRREALAYLDRSGVPVGD